MKGTPIAHQCAFCNEQGFDLMGLKHHLRMYCQGYELTPCIVMDKVLNENVVQISSDNWVWLKDGTWQTMTVEDQIAWTGRN